MYIEALSDQTECDELFKEASRIAIWNGRQVEELNENSQPAILRALNEKHESLSTRVSAHHSIKPMMTKAGVSYSEKEGWKGEITVSVDLFKSESNDNSSSSASDSGSSDSSTGEASSGEVGSSDNNRDDGQKG